MKIVGIGVVGIKRKPTFEDFEKEHEDINDARKEIAKQVEMHRKGIQLMEELDKELFEYQKEAFNKMREIDEERLKKKYPYSTL